MPDICMCISKECNLRKTCYRHRESGTEPDEYRQSVCDFSTNTDQGGCDRYWKSERVVY